MVPVVQRLPEKLAWLVARHGFGVLPIVEQARYGRGLYFTTSLEYLDALTTSQPTTTATPSTSAANQGQEQEDEEFVYLLSLVVPGNAFPVLTEKGDSLVGRSAHSGYQSHYTVASITIEGNKEVEGSELVIFDASQVLPLFIWEIKKTTPPRVAPQTTLPIISTAPVPRSPPPPAMRKEWNYSLDSTWNSQRFPPFHSFPSPFAADTFYFPSISY